jgi:pyruvate/2-oxoacid:ferredoxin oxidoreductase beta subunit
MKELLCLLGCIALIELFVIVYLLCVLSDIKGQRKVHNKSYEAMETKFKDQLTEMESRAQNAESDLTQERIEKDRNQRELYRKIKACEDLTMLLLEDALTSTNENTNLRSELAELKEKHSRKNQKRVKGKFA